MIKTIITVALALHFLSDPVGNVQNSVDIGAPIVVGFFDGVVNPLIKQINDESDAMASSNNQ